MGRLFLSHSWSTDKHNRNTHLRVKKIKYEIEKLGFSTWFDEEKMIFDINGSMANGIDQCQIVIIFLTTEYCEKVNKSALNPCIDDNCYKECSYAILTSKIIIPVICENNLLRHNNWPNGCIKFFFGNKFYINGTNDNYQQIALDISNYIKKIKQMREIRKINDNLNNNLKYKRINNKLRKPTRIAPIFNEEEEEIYNSNTSSTSNTNQDRNNRNSQKLKHILQFLLLTTNKTNKFKINKTNNKIKT